MSPSPAKKNQKNVRSHDVAKGSLPWRYFKPFLDKPTQGRF